MPLLRMSVRWWALTLSLALFAAASPLAAQTAWSLGPFVGAYRAMGSFEQASIYDTDLPYTPQALNGNAWGAEARAWFGGRWGAQLQVSSSSSTIGPTISPGGPTRSRTANVQLATAQALYNILPAQSPGRLWLGAGLGAVRHVGNAYANYGSPVNLAGVVGLGVSLPIMQHVSATAGATGAFYFYNLAMPPMYALNPGSMERGRQADVLYHVGLAWRWR